MRRIITIDEVELRRRPAKFAAPGAAARKFDGRTGSAVGYRDGE